MTSANTSRNDRLVLAQHHLDGLATQLALLYKPDLVKDLAGIQAVISEIRKSHGESRELVPSLKKGTVLSKTIAITVLFACSNDTGNYGETNAKRLGSFVNLVEDSGKINLQKTIDVLDLGSTEPTASVRILRGAVNKTWSELKTGLTFTTDTNKRSKPEKRHIWIEVTDAEQAKAYITDLSQ